MPRRLVLTLIALGLAMALTAAPASAGGGSLSIGDGGADGEVGQTFYHAPPSGTIWVPDNFCGLVGRGPTDPQNEYRTAFEFPLAGRSEAP